MPKCKGCGAYIDFVLTSSGKSIPVDPLYIMVNRNAKKPDTTIITDSGNYIRGKAITKGQYLKGEKSNEFYAVGRASHFATCPAANKFRKKVR